MKKLLNLSQKPDAVYAAGDYAALGAYQVMKEEGIKVPEEIALVGFGNEPFTSLVSPSISSVNQNSAEIGKIAAERFLYRIENPEEEVTLTKHILNAELIVRGSSNKKE